MGVSDGAAVKVAAKFGVRDGVAVGRSVGVLTIPAKVGIAGGASGSRLPQPNSSNIKTMHNERRCAARGGMMKKVERKEDGRCAPSE